jgi:hypothetical protein
MDYEQSPHAREKEWPELRKLGRERFAWKHRAIPMGVVVGLALAMWLLFDMSYTPREIVSISGLSVIYLSVSVAILFAYVEARLEWTRREVFFQTERGYSRLQARCADALRAKLTKKGVQFSVTELDAHGVDPRIAVAANEFRLIITKERAILTSPNEDVEFVASRYKSEEALIETLTSVVERATRS